MSPCAPVLDWGHGGTLIELLLHHGSASAPGASKGALSKAPCTHCPSAGPRSRSGMNWHQPTSCSPGMCSRSWNAVPWPLHWPGQAWPLPRASPLPALPSCSSFPIKEVQAAELWCWRKTGVRAKSDGAKWRVVRHKGSSESTPAPTQQHLAPAFPAPLAGNVAKVPLLVTLVCPPPPHCLSHSPSNTARGRWGGRSVSALPAFTAELNCSQHFYFKPHNVFEEVNSVHS